MMCQFFILSGGVALSVFLTVCAFWTVFAVVEFLVKLFRHF